MRRGTAVLVLLLGACTADPGGQRAELLHEGDATLAVIRTLSSPPPGGDGASRVELGWRRRDGSVVSVGLLRAVIAWETWGSSGVAVDEDHGLWLVREGTAPERIGDHATGELAVSRDAALLAWVAVGGVLGAVRVRDGAGNGRAIAGELQSAGALRFTPDGTAVLFRGGRLGGVAGLLVAEVGGAGVRCLTNCELRTGAPWGDSFVAGPGSADELDLDGDFVTWTAAGAQRVTRRWRGGVE